MLRYFSDLIFDVGMHTGIDTEFYLRKGFRVVAVEANSELTTRANQKFHQEIADGRLVIIPKAIASRPGMVNFWFNQTNDEWSSLAQEYVSRNARVGAPSSARAVPAVLFSDLLRDHGIPYYLKIDIEGADHLCLESLHDFECRPPFVSVETSGTNDFGYTFQLLAHLYLLGYRHFKLVNQYMLHTYILPNPPREGEFVEYRFPRNASSGPFGEETPGPWVSIEAIIEKYRGILRLQNRYTVQAKRFRPVLSLLYYRLHGLFRREPVGWYDIHAKFDPGDEHPDAGLDLKSSS